MAIDQDRDYGGWRSNGSEQSTEQRIATGLGWFSVGLGIWELVAPGSLARFIGVEEKPGTLNLLRFYGVREIAAGVGILSQSQPAGWLWARVAGDALDLASLGSSFTSDNADSGKLAFATAAVLGVTALDIYCGQRMSESNVWNGGRIRVAKGVIINRSQEELYRFWREFENFPSFMDHLESVRATGERTSHWIAKAPAGTTVEWDAELVDDERNRLIAWRSLPGADVDNSGTVRFQPAPGGRGTMVRVEMQYAPPGGVISAKIAKLFGQEPEMQLDAALRALKQIMETGEVIRSDSSIHRGMHAARPTGREEMREMQAEQYKGSGNLQPV